CEVLPHVVDAAGDLCEIYVDGGTRRGSDVLKALALGARAVLIGRPILWGLCVAGERGAAHVLQILRRELDEAMLLCGCTKLSDIDESLLRPWPAQCHLIDTSLRGLTLRPVAGSSAKSMPSSIRPAVTRRKFLSATLAAGAIVLTEGLQKLMTAATTSTTNPAFLLGGDLDVNRLGYGAMRLT